MEKMSRSVIEHEIAANRDSLRFGLHAVRGDIVGTHPLQSLRESVSRLPQSLLLNSIPSFFFDLFCPSCMNCNPRAYLILLLLFFFCPAFGSELDQTSRFWEEKKRFGRDLTYGSAFNLRRDLDAQILSRYLVLLLVAQ